MSFLVALKETLETQQTYDGLPGKYESRFRVGGDEYAFIATSTAGIENDNTDWMLEFENVQSHRIGTGDINPLIAKSFADAVKIWVEFKNPHSFYTYGSSIESLQAIIEAIKKSVKKYEVKDLSTHTDDNAQSDGSYTVSNPVGKIMWSKIKDNEDTSTEDRANTKLDKFVDPYEQVSDIKTNKSFTSGIKADKLDRVTEGVLANVFKAFVPVVANLLQKKFKQKVDEMAKIATDPQKLAQWIKTNKKAFVAGVDLFKEIGSKKNLSDKADPIVVMAASLVSSIASNSDIKDIDELKTMGDDDVTNLVGGEAGEVATESFVDFMNSKEDSINEGAKIDALLKKAKSVANKFKEKFGDQFSKVAKIASDPEKLRAWLDDNKEAYLAGVELVKHLTDKKELTFESQIENGFMVNEGIVDLIAKKTPKALMAAALILSVMSSGSNVFGANASAEASFTKAKENVEKIAQISQEQFDKTGKKVGDKLEFGSKLIKGDIDKGIKDASKKIGKQVDDAKENLGAGLSQTQKDLVAKGDSTLKATVDNLKAKGSAFNAGLKAGYDKSKSDAEFGLDSAKQDVKAKVGGFKSAVEQDIESKANELRANVKDQSSRLANSARTKSDSVYQDLGAKGGAFKSTVEKQIGDKANELKGKFGVEADSITAKAKVKAKELEQNAKVKAMSMGKNVKDAATSQAQRWLDKLK